MQKNGQFESIRSLTSILLQDVDKCKIARENVNFISNDQRTNHIVSDVTVDNITSKRSAMNSFVKKPSSKKPLLKFLLIIGFSIGMGICLAKINTLSEELNKRDQMIGDKDTMITKYDEPGEHLIKLESLCEKKSRPWDFLAKLRNAQQRKGTIVAGLDQLQNPLGFYVDENPTIYIADTGNHRIVAWKKDAATGKQVAGGDGPGAKENSLNSPISVLIDHKTDSFIIADCENKHIVRWSRANSSTGETIIRNTDCFGLAMGQDDYLYFSDAFHVTIKRWAMGEPPEGTLVAGQKGQGYGLDQFNQPKDLTFDQQSKRYVLDWGNTPVQKFLASDLK